MFERLMIALRLKKKPVPPVPFAPPVKRYTPTYASTQRRRDDDIRTPSPSPATDPWSSAPWSNTTSWAPASTEPTSTDLTSERGGQFGGGGASGSWDVPSPLSDTSSSCDSGGYSSDFGSSSSDSGSTGSCSSD